jgi:hypothetical protein
MESMIRRLVQETLTKSVIHGVKTSGGMLSQFSTPNPKIHFHQSFHPASFRNSEIILNVRSQNGTGLKKGHPVAIVLK